MHRTTGFQPLGGQRVAGAVTALQMRAVAAESAGDVRANQPDRAPGGDHLAEKHITAHLQPFGGQRVAGAVTALQMRAVAA